MVILTVTCASGDEMVYFDKPLVVERIALKLSIWINGWYNLPEPAKFLWKEGGKTAVVNIEPGYYYIDSMKNIFNQTAFGHVCTLEKVETQIKWKLQIKKIVWFSRNLYELLGLTDGVEGDTGEGVDYVLLSPGNYTVNTITYKQTYIYCDIVDPHDSLSRLTSSVANNPTQLTPSVASKPSNLLACVKNNESRFGITYFRPTNPTFLKAKWGCHTGVRMTARNEFGDIINFNGKSVNYVLELDVANTF